MAPRTSAAVYALRDGGTGMSEPTISTVELHGARVRVKRAGAGAPLVLLHGTGGAANWHPFMARLAERFDVCYDKDLVDRPDQLAVQVTDADALIVRNRTSVDEALLNIAPSLRVVGRLGVGLDNIDQKARAARAND